MIQAEPRIDAANLQEQLEPDVEAPLKFYMDRMLRDELMRRELLFRYREVVSDPEVKKMIDKCIESIQTEAQRKIEQKRKNSHAHIQRLNETIERSIIEIERTRCRNEVLKAQINELAKLFGKGPDCSKAEIKEVLEQLNKAMQQDLIAKGEHEKTVRTVMDRMRSKKYRPLALRDTYEERQSELRRLTTDLNSKRQLKKRLNELIRIKRTRGLQLDLQLERLKKEEEPVEVLKRTTLQPKRHTLKPIQEIKYLVGEKFSQEGSGKYMALILLVLLTWSIILSIKAYNVTTS